MLAYYGTEISPNQTETAEGFLICRNVPIARTGEMQYLAGELQLEGDPDRQVTVYRTPEDVFEAAAVASFEGKPVTDGHPPENVGPENFSAYARGHVQNVRREGDFLLADLYINDAALASDVQNRVKREVSCGYLCTYVPDRDGYRQEHIRGNHVAVVPRGRAGHEVAIKDAAQEAEKGRHRMSEFWKSVLTAFGMAAKDASPEELDAMVSTTATVLDAAPEESKAEEPPVQEEKGTGREKEAQADAMESKLNRVIDMISEMMAAIQAKNAQGEAPLRDEKALDNAVEQLSGQEAATVPADDGAQLSPAARDAAVMLLKGIRPAVAAIKDAKERSRVVDALISSIQDQGKLGELAAAAQASAQKAADQAAMTSYEKRCEDSQSAYAARNPHKRLEKEV